MLDSGLLNNFAVDLVLVGILGITRVPWRQTRTSSSTDYALLSVRIIWCCKLVRSINSPIIVCLLPIITILILVSVYSSLPMLAHRYELLIWVALTRWWHVLLNYLILKSLVIIIYLSDRPVIVLVARSNPVTCGLLA